MQFFLSFAVGILVGVIYAVLQVRSPAPPVVALIGLLGMCMGESVVLHWRHPPLANQAIVSQETGLHSP